MALSARLPLAVDRYGACVRTVIIRGLDLTGVTMRAQVRLRPDTPGDPLVDLDTVDAANAEGLHLVSAAAGDDGVMVSTVQIRINETTLEGLPYSGELGDNSTFAWDWQATIGGDKRRLAYGDFVVLAGVTGADDAPTDRFLSYSPRPSASTWSTAQLTFGDEIVEITIDGADVVAGLVDQAVSASADALTAADNVATYGGSSVLSPNEFTAAELRGTKKDRLVATANSYVATRVSGEPAIQLVAQAGVVTTSHSWRLQRDPGASIVSASVRILSSEAGVSGGRVLLQQYSAAGTEITAKRQTNAYQTAAAITTPVLISFGNVAIDANCVEIRLLIENANTGGVTTRTVIYRDFMIAYGPSSLFRPPDAFGKTVYVDKSATLGNGSETYPYPSLKTAIASLGQSGTIVITGGGDYAEASLDASGLRDLKIVVAPGINARFLGGVKVTGITKSSGYTKVYQATLSSGNAALLANLARFIFQDGVPDAKTVVDAAERHSLQRPGVVGGVNYRLPNFSRIFVADSIATIDAADGPMWYLDGTTLYFSIEGGGDATAATIYIPANTMFINKSTRLRLEMVGVDVYYYSFGVDGGIDTLILRGCGQFASKGNGLEYDNCRFVQTYLNRAGGNGNDGMGGHHVGNEAYPCAAMHANAWSFDNYDDGESDHEGIVCTVDGGLFEYNGGRGVIPALGARTTCSGALSRWNGQTQDTEGQGFMCLGGGEAAACDGTQLVTIDCIAVSNTRNFAVSGGDTAKSRHLAIRPISISPVGGDGDVDGSDNPIQPHFKAQSDGVLEVIGGKVDATGVVKMEDSGGTVTFGPTLQDAA